MRCLPCCGSAAGTMTVREFVMKIRYSVLYTIYCVLLVLFSTFLFSWSIYKRGRGEELWFIILEGVATIPLCIEIPINLYVQKRSYFKMWWNWLHLLLTLLCLSAWIVLYGEYLYIPSLSIWGDAAYIEDLTIIIHCVFLLIIERHRSRADIKRNGRIALNVVYDYRNDSHEAQSQNYGTTTYFPKSSVLEDEPEEPSPLTNNMYSYQNQSNDYDFYSRFT
ncbi:4 TM domain-containing transmembrane protein [Acrasis kona]|uniref:4 TM domain-containing transmembrane protein n=1 Tax=Acrasis kona TaxID=1008807 RepID=A0AAW2ZBM9_9EUKA